VNAAGRSPRTRQGPEPAAPGSGALALAPWWNPRAPFLPCALVLLVTRAIFWLSLPSASEDAYITYRYARNVVRGLGPVFNPGEHVLGYTSPLWMAWNALGIAILKDPIAWSRVTTVGLELGALYVITRALGAYAGRLAAWSFGLFYAGWTFFAAMAVSGMENSAVFALLALTAAAVARRSAWTGPLLGALALSRPEGAVLAVVVAMFAGWRARAVGLVLAAAGYVALAAYYGSPIPQSLVAKAAVYGTPGPWAGRHWWEWISPVALGRWPVTSEGSILFALAVVFAPALVAGIASLAPRWREARALAALSLAGLTVWFGYAVVGVAYFAWYLVLPLGTAAVLVAIGLPRIARGAWLPVSLLLFVAGTWSVAPALYTARAYAEYESFGQAARALGLNSSPGQSVFLEPIGMVGWGCRLRVIDEIGLVSPKVAARRKQGDGWYADVVADQNPDWLVTRRGILAGAGGGEAFAGAGRPFRTAAERDALLARYHLLATIHPEAGDNAMEIRGLQLPAHPVDSRPEGAP
jgi:hypothetical protein